MGTDIDKKKKSDTFTNLVQNTVDLSKKAASNAKSGVLSMMEKAKNDSYVRKLKKYNPLFPDRYQSADFHLPNMIMIVDDAVRRGIDVCEGSIGWLGTESGVEILYLYDEAVEFSGIQFIPTAACDAIYYVDNFDRNRFVNTDCLFTRAHEEKLAELKHIAHSLGARKCTIEISESSTNNTSQKKSVSVNESYHSAAEQEGGEQSISLKGFDSRSGHIEIEFSGNSEPERPTLKWFAHDDNILRLIDMCCSGKNSVKTETLELSGSSSATMSQKTAYAIDCAIGQVSKMSGQVSMDAQAAKEHKRKLLFHIEF
ncbi:MAG: hypothetical protein IJC35_03435 [Oscillospiraceae bacterium]|nr:hypothetical protein [Oscillospiraceae bacterium]